MTPALSYSERVETLVFALGACVDGFGDALSKRQFEVDIDPLHRARGEVLLGFASRLWRLTKYVCCNPMLWSDARAAYEIRAIVDSCIVSRWFLLQAPDAFDAYVAYGRGQLKLYKLHAENLADIVGDGSLDAFLKDLGDLVNTDVLEEFQRINVGGAFPGTTLRAMAEIAGVKTLYDLRYQPLSAEAHGQWDSLMIRDLAESTDPLHDGHRFGVFCTAQETINTAVALEALLLALETIAAIFDGLGVDIQPEAQRCWDAAVGAHSKFDTCA